ncbi:MAG TPA: pentapeptide repeat-containing protein [Thermoanaerobaculia bacterium]|nr:pentapeptide repeat-containing protein [Thermoanaerobaculia bacterium]
MDRHSAQFKPHSDLTYQTFENLTIADTDLRQCLFTGAVFRNVTFQRVNFRRSDFDAARFEFCTFDSCDLSIDMRSSLFAKSSFESCKVETAFITDCTFDTCRLGSIQFDDCAISNNRWTDCEFEQCSLTQSTFVHNIVRRTSFFSTNMGDCTFLYVIMTACRFSDSLVNAESVGMIYGLTIEDVKTFRYVHLGAEQKVPAPKDLPNNLLEQYAARSWRIGVAVLKLNFGTEAPLHVFHEYLVASRIVIERGTPVNREELLFLAKLLEELAVEHRMPVATCFEVMHWCAAVVDLTEHTDSIDAPRVAEAARELSNKAFLLSQDALDSIEQSDAGRILALGEDTEILAKLTFDREPSIALSELLTSLGTISGLAIVGPSSRVRSHPGSWVEYVQTTLVSLAAMRIFLFFINGVLFDVTEARARVEMLVKKRLPKDFVDLAMRPRDPVSASLIKPLKRLAGEALATEWLEDPQIKGLTAENVKTISISPAPNTDTTDVARR